MTCQLPRMHLKSQKALFNQKRFHGMHASLLTWLVKEAFSSYKFPLLPYRYFLLLWIFHFLKIVCVCLCVWMLMGSIKEVCLRTHTLVFLFAPWFLMNRVSGYFVPPNTLTMVCCLTASLKLITKWLGTSKTENQIKCIWIQSWSSQAYFLCGLKDDKQIFDSFSINWCS